MALQANPSFRLAPSSVKAQLPSNYISLYDYSSQYLPDTHEELQHIYGNQSITGMLSMMSAEYPITSDTYIWSEEGRLHTNYSGVTRSANVFTQADHVFRVNELIHVSDGNDSRVGIITAVTADTFTARPYKQAGWGTVGTTGITVFAFGSEFRKGTDGMQQSKEADFTVLQNSPIILKDVYIVSGSDATNIGWVKTKQGYFWFLESEDKIRREWEDRLELAMLLGQSADTGSEAEAAGFKGTEGLFESVRSRGNVFQGLASDLDDWDSILKRFDAQGKIQDYMFYVDRDQSLAIDNLLGTLNAGYDGGISYGIFDNEKEMSVNLGFVGFRRGTYNFFKSDWKLLNDPTLLGSVAAAGGKTRGLLVPVGTKEVYEGQGMDGEKMMLPYLHLKYKQNAQESRKYKTWVTGSVGGVYTDDTDVMRVNHLSERGLCTVGANNFMIFEGS